MRSIERLIRQLTNARIAIVRQEQKSALKSVRQQHSLKEAPTNVQAAVRRLNGIATEKRRLEAVIAKAGYRSYLSGDGTLYRTAASAETSAINAKAESRVGKLEALRSEALIDTIGTTPEAAKSALVAFRAAILKA